MKILGDITEFIFVESDLAEIEEVDIIFIPGSSKYQLPEVAAKLYKKGFTKRIMPAGKYSSKIKGFLTRRLKVASMKAFMKQREHFVAKYL